MNFFKYQIEFYDEEKESMLEQGITFGENYADAISKVIKFYGEKDTISVYLTKWNDYACMPISAKVLEALEFDEV